MTAAAGELELAMLAYCDLGAIVRGRLIPIADLSERPDSTVGWVPSAVARPPFGHSVRENPFGPVGDLRLLPDSETRIRIPSNGAIELMLCDLVDPDGRPWDCCPRGFLRQALDDVQYDLGARLLASFEHEFQLRLDAPPLPAMSIAAHLRIEPFPSRVMRELREGGLTPAQFVPESAPHQYEIPMAASEGLASADRAVLFREIVRETACQLGIPITFSPILDASEKGNGVHIHLSLVDRNGKLLFYDGERPGRLSELGGSFAAGILRHAGALTALTSPSPVSFARLRPGSRSAGVVCLGDRNREAFLRLPPIIAIGGQDAGSQVRLEYRAADAAANPYLALGAILRAGLDGVRNELSCPEILDQDPQQLTSRERSRYVVGDLPRNLREALEVLARDRTVASWMSPRLYGAYRAIKLTEIEAAEAEEFAESCRRYASIY